MSASPGPVGSTSTVYIETGPAEAETEAGVRRRLIDTARAGRHLREFGYRVVLVRGAGAVREGTRRGRSDRPTLASLPGDAGGWLVSARVDTCLRARRGGRLRTVLLGPKPPGETPLGRPADLQARSLLDAVLVIVAGEATPAA
ncbi:MAG: hypothetical protein A2V85_09180 [Chloroflexi bacterium RBG_16_72_14]|nr:MAG: hypothetical protein A2V85_09180 [Chloroflexi bacterium RBG_16_72_14]